MGKVLGDGGDAEQYTIGGGFDGLAIGHKLEDTYPAVATIAFPTSAEALDIPHHLVNFFSSRVFVATIGRIVEEVLLAACYFVGMAGVS